jgi:hypothetical protein
LRSHDLETSTPHLGSSHRLEVCEAQKRVKRCQKTRRRG